MSLAIACGLHTIESLDLNAQTTTSLLGPAKDVIELGDRINMFWMLFSVDRVASILLGAVPRGPVDEKITTIWPCPSEYYQDGRALLQHYGTVKSLYNLKLNSIWDLSDNPTSLRTKGYAMLYHASTLVAQSKIHGSPSRTNEIRIASHSISNFAHSLSACQYIQFETIDVDGAKSALITASAAAHAAVVQINGIFAQTDPDALRRQRNACKNSVLAAKEMAKLGDQYFPLLFCVTLAPTYHFLISEVERQDDERDKEHIRADINILLRTLERLKKCMPQETAVSLDGLWLNSIFA